MDHTHNNFKHLLVKLVLQVADQYSIKQISNISFLCNNTTIVDCCWDCANSATHELYEGSLGLPDVIFYEGYDAILPTKVEIAGIDIHDNPINLFLPLEFVQRKSAA